MKEHKKPSIDFALCVNCGVCVQACPVSCITLSVRGVDKLNSLFPRVQDEVCTGCSLCARECPVESITMI